MTSVKLYNRDCIEVMAGIESGSVDLILTDPPYYSTNLHFDKAPRIDYGSWLLECKRVLKPHGVLVTYNHTECWTFGWSFFQVIQSLYQEK